MRRILFSLAMVGLIGGFVSSGEASAAQARSTRATQTVNKTHHVKKAHAVSKNQAVNKTPATHRNHKVRSFNKARPSNKVPASGKAPSFTKRSVGSTSTSRKFHNVSSGPVRRYFGTRLYYSNAFRGMIPGTGYGGFRRPAFGNRSY